MWYLYLDESGDLGFDFVNKKPSRFFTIAILALQGQETNRKLGQAVWRTLRRASHSGGARPREIKGSETPLRVKRQFYEQVRDLSWAVYAVTLNKRQVYERLTREKERLYNYVARLALDRIPFEKADTRVELIVDRSKGKPEIHDFNQYVVRQLQGRLDPKVPLNINHLRSHETPGLQAADLFCWGVFRKHEKRDEAWFSIFRERVRLDRLFL